jgi:hypothetical protein
MLVGLSVRKLRPGAYEEFRSAWQPDEFPPGFDRAFHIRGVRDPDEVISFGFIEGEAADVDAIRGQIADVEERRQRAMAPYVVETVVDGIYEVADEVAPT